MNTLPAARLISAAGHPLVLAPLSIALATRNLRLVAVFAATAVLPLAAVIVRQVRRGAWTNFDVSRHEQRSGLYFVAFPILAVAALALHFSGGGAQMTRGFYVATAMLAAGLLANRFLKVSLHMMIGAFSCAIIARVYPAALPLIAVGLTLIAWSRRRLDAHTWPEIAVGLVIGIAAGAYLVL